MRPFTYNIFTLLWITCMSLCMVFIPKTVQAQGQEVTGTATAELVDILAGKEISSLAFGRFYIEGETTTGGITIKPSPEIERTTTGGSLFLVSGGLEGPAIYEITGYPESTIAVTLPGVTQIVHSSNPSFQMTVNQWTVSPSTAPQLDANGKLTLFLGASLRIETISKIPLVSIAERILWFYPTINTSYSFLCYIC